MNDVTAHEQRARTGREGAGQPTVGVVFPGDNRQKVVDTRQRPYWWIGQLTAEWPDGTRTAGTATLVGEQHLLTCGHNFYDTKKGFHCKNATFRPGLTTDTQGNLVEPYGQYAVVTRHVPEDYVKNGGPPPPNWGIDRKDITKYLSDYAVGVLGRPVPEPPGRSMLGPFWPGDTNVNGLGCRINGYSGDKDQTASTQFTRTGEVSPSRPDATFVSYRMSTYHGDSGAGVFYYDTGREYWAVIAVHVTGVQDSGVGKNDGINFGPSMNEGALEWVQHFLLSS